MDNLISKCDDIVSDLESYKNIPGMSSFIKKLKQDPKEGHVLHGDLIKKFLKSTKFEITSVDNNSNRKDVDIEINKVNSHHTINIQVWYGQNLSKLMGDCLTHAKEKNVEIKGRIYKIKEFGGGIKPVREEDSDIPKKLDQLPDANLGLVICHNLAMNLSPGWIEKLPDNKAIVNIFSISFDRKFSKIYGQSHLYCSNIFKYINLTKNLLSELGFPIKIIH